MEALGPIDTQRQRCQEARDALRKLTRIHVEIDAPGRKAGAHEPDWVFRLRKVCLHAVAVSRCNVDVDGAHAMATELRAAYEQMGAIWKCLPNEFRFEEDGDWWTTEASDRLAEYDHPTPLGLAMSLSEGGFADAEASEAYLRLVIWLGRLGCGYGLALARLARLLGTAGDIDSRLQAALPDMR